MTPAARACIFGAVTGLAAFLLGYFCGKADARPTLIVQDQAAIVENTYGLRDRALAATKDLGGRVVRINALQWRPGEPGDAPFAVHRAGLKVQLTIAGDLSYVRAMVKAYRPVVGTYAIWNEPELAAWRCCKAPFHEARGWGPPRSYRAHYVRAYRLIKRLDPRAKVLIGELSPHGMVARWGTVQRRRPWFAATLRRGRPLKADGVAVHPYHWTWNPRVGKQYFGALKGWRDQVRRWGKLRALRTPRGRSVPIHSTEFGMRVGIDRPGDAARAFRYCARLKFRQCAQYMILPSGQAWNTSLTDKSCRPTAAYFQLRKAVTGKPHSAPVPFKPCPAAAPFIAPKDEGDAPYRRYMEDE